MRLQTQKTHSNPKVDKNYEKIFQEEKKVLDWNHVSDEEDHLEIQEQQIQLKKKVSVIVPKEESVNLSEDEEEAENVTYEEILKLELHLKALKQTEYQLHEQQLKQKSYDDQIQGLQNQIIAEERELKSTETEVQAERNACLKTMTDLAKHQIYNLCHNDSSQKVDE